MRRTRVRGHKRRGGIRVRAHDRRLNQAGFADVKIASVVVRRVQGSRGHAHVHVAVEYVDRDGHRNTLEGEAKSPLIQRALMLAHKQGKRFHFVGGASYADLLEAEASHPVGANYASGTRDPLAERLFVGVFPEGIVYADRAKEEHGDYKKIAFLPFRTLRLDVYAPKSPLLPLIRQDAARMQARRGQQFEVSASGQTVTLGTSAG